MTSYDLIVIGAGAAGSTCAEKVNDAGKQVALIERDALGGTCLNYGCDPTKAGLYLAKIWHDARKLPAPPSEKAGSPELWFWFQEKIQAVQENMRGGSMAEAREQMRERGIELIMGEAAFVSPHEIEVNGRTLTADNFLIATGSEPDIPDIPGLASSEFVTNRNIWNLPLQPTHLAIIGGGPVGVEFAQLFARLGTKVTLIELADQILPKDEPELAAELENILIEEGIEIKTQAEVTNVVEQEGGQKITITYESNYEEQIEVSHLLLAGGRKSVTDGLDLDKAGVLLEDNQVKTDLSLRTNVPHIWAAGDVTADFQFTHVAWRQGDHVAENILNGQTKKFDIGPIPWVTYTEPELANVGLTESQLEESGRPYLAVSQPMSENARAIVTGRPQGCVKLLVDDANRILGAHVLAVNGGELLSPVLLAMKEGLPATVLADLVFPYPTLSAVWRKLSAKLKDEKRNI